MENQLLKKAIDSGFITFDGLCSSWQKLSKVSQGIDPQVLDAILTVKPNWVDHMYSPMYFGYNALIFSLYLVRPVELKSITLLGLAIAYEDAAAEDVIKKHYSKLGCDESAVAVIGADTRQKVSSDLLRELVKISKTKNVRPSILTEKVKALLMSLSGDGFIKTAEERRYFSPYVMENLNKIFGYMGGGLWGDDLASSILSVGFEEKKDVKYGA